MEDSLESVQEPAFNKRGLSLFSWAIYDWANSAFAAVIQTFIFAEYFVKNVAYNEVFGTTAWGMVTGIAAFIVALLGPILGAVADQSGGRKIWLAIFTLICVIPTCLLWYVRPSPEYTWMALWCVGIGSIGAEGAYIFYNAMLPELASESELGRWSGWGWGMGYAGGMAALILSLLLFVQSSPWFLIENKESEPVRATFLLSAAWYALFALPLFLFTPHSPSTKINLKEAYKKGMHQLKMTFLEIRKYKTIVRFLLAKMFYVDGLATLFAFGGIYAASVFGMEQIEVLQFGIAMSITAGLGSASLAFLDDRLGSKKVILYSLLGLIIPGICAFLTTKKWLFWTFGLMMCLFVGPVQSSSRSLMARLAPTHMRREMFGFYMFSGKATAFFGPLFFGWTAYLMNSVRWGMATILLLFIIGGMILFHLEDGNEKNPNSGKFQLRNTVLYHPAAEGDPAYPVIS